MKFLDYLIIAALLAVLAVAWVGFRVEAALAGAVVIMVASWRFWDKRQGRKLPRSASGDNVPDLPDTADNAGGDLSSGDGGND